MFWGCTFLLQQVVETFNTISILLTDCRACIGLIKLFLQHHCLDWCIHLGPLIPGGMWTSLDAQPLLRSLVSTYIMLLFFYISSVIYCLNFIVLYYCFHQNSHHNHYHDLADCSGICSSHLYRFSLSTAAFSNESSLFWLYWRTAYIISFYFLHELYFSTVLFCFIVLLLLLVAVGPSNNASSSNSSNRH
jgi:hypothetical protein